jgi:hypothetical protein
MGEIPEGFTDDMSIALPPGRSAEDVVDLILRAEAQKMPYETTLSELIAFGLSEDDAMLAHDRALGGLVRAATRNPRNEPPKEKDPIAWTSYQRCLREPALIAAIRPQYVAQQDGAKLTAKRRWWQFWK